MKEDPAFLIELGEPGLIGLPNPSDLKGKQGADTWLDWQLADSVRDRVNAPLDYASSYVGRDALPDVLQHNQVMVVSSRLREAIEPWLKDYEFIPVNVRLSLSLERDEDFGAGEVIQNYWWLNSWRRLDIVDWYRSKMIASVTPGPESRYSRTPIRAINWKQLFLKDGMPEGEHFFGLARVQSEWRFLSAELYEHLRRSRMKLRFNARMVGRPNYKSAFQVERELNTPPT